MSFETCGPKLNRIMKHWERTTGQCLTSVKNIQLNAFSLGLERWSDFVSLLSTGCIFLAPVSMVPPAFLCLFFYPHLSSTMPAHPGSVQVDGNPPGCPWKCMLLGRERQWLHWVMHWQCFLEASGASISWATCLAASEMP